MSLHGLLRRDKRVRQLREMLRNGSYALNTGEFIREIESLHATRLTRQLVPTDVTHRFQTRFMRAILQNQATRSRVVEIKMRCVRTQARMKEHLRNLTKYLMATYAEQLRAAAKTKGERENIVSSVFGNAEQLLDEINTTMSIADLVVADLDATGWRINNMTEIMKQVIEKGKQY